MTAPAAAKRTMTRDAIRAAVLGADDRAHEYVEVPQWGGITLKVVALTGADRDRYQQASIVYGRDAKGMPIVQAYNMVNAPARLVSLTVVDEDGERVFNEADVLALGDRSPVALDRVANVARRLSGLEQEAIEAAKHGLKTDQSASSGSD